MPRKNSRLLAFLTLGFVIALATTAILAFSTMREVIAGWELPGFLGEAFNPSQEEVSTPIPVVMVPTLNPSAPLQPAGFPEPAAWDGTTRVTVLVMGVDFRDWAAGQGPPRTNSMILMTLDPKTGTAGMLSIPRDLWVLIPGFDYGKINTAYQLGEAYNLENGGPGLAIETVEQLIGVPIDFYVQVDFYSFVRLIDEVGGVKIDIPEEIEVDPVGDRPPRVLQPGVTVLPGDLALAYARARNTIGGDFDRADRQQQLVLAIRDRVLSFDLLPILIAKAPVIYQEIAAGIQTNLTLEQTIRLGLLGIQIQPADINRAVIGPDFVIFDTSFLGAAILRPIPDKIRELREEIFPLEVVVNPVIEDKTPEELVFQEDAQIALLNGTFVPGLAASTKEYLEDRGLTVSVTENASELYEATAIIDYTGNPYTLEYLVDLMDINNARVYHSYDPASQVDIEITLGDDWVTRGVLP